MCLQKSSVSAWDSWNWAGDRIVPSPIILASRTLPTNPRKRYNIDIREFLTTINNAVVHDRLNELIHELPMDEQSLFRSHSRGSFDLRADRVVGFLGRFKYLPSARRERRGPDAWLFPDETLCQGGGDCEDLAFLLAAFLIAAGISSYCVRVAMGRLNLTFPDGETVGHDHSWVMYQNEDGIWEILEPIHVVASPAIKAKATAKARPAAKSAEYVPHFVFNVDHLWQIDSCHIARQSDFLGYIHKRDFWYRFDPSFAASVHDSIFDQAFEGITLPSGALSAMKRKSLFLDVNIFTYDPRDHFDNGCIADGWRRVASNLAAFKKQGNDWASFGAAAHAIADFYAHSSYAHFARFEADGSLAIYDPGAALDPSPGYTSSPAGPGLPPFDLTSGKFSNNPELWTGTPAQAAANWKDKLISGRYAQRHDRKAGFWEGFTSIPKELTNAQGFALRGSLPHHNEIAVDELPRPDKHVLYSDTRSGPNDRMCFENQFNWRRDAATRHIAQAYAQIVPQP